MILGQFRLELFRFRFYDFRIVQVRIVQVLVLVQVVMNCYNCYKSFIELLGLGFDELLQNSLGLGFDELLQNCLGLGVGFDDSLGFNFMILLHCCLAQVLIANFFYLDMYQNQNQGNVQGDDKKKEKSPMT